jgi:undecaprenyl-phosphate glucose phosphotransferase
VSIESDVRDKVDQFELPSNLYFANFSAQAIPFLLPLIDVFTILLCSVAGAIAYHLVVHNPVPDLTPQFAVGLLASLLYVLQMSRTGFYELSVAGTNRLELRNIVVHWSATALLLVLVAFLLKVGDTFSRGTFIVSFFLTPVSLLVTRKLSKIVLAEAVSTGMVGRRDTVLLGEYDEMLALRPQDLLAACGATEVNRFTLSREGDSETRDAADARTIKLLADYVRRHNCRQILLAVPWSDSDRIDFIRDELKALPVAARLLPDLRARSLASLTWSGANRISTIEVQRAPLNGMQRCVKRSVDVLVSSLALIFFVPVMALTAIAIKLDSPGPIIFRQTRRGFNGRQFVIFKFRTMTVQENGPAVIQAARDDARVTNLGRLLRSSSIDELPQLLNVLKGDMSLVGPRPHALAHDSYFESVLSDYAFRHHVKPGITGWAQCNGARGATPSIEHVSKRVKLDLWYINNWSLWLDLQILLKTAFEVAKKNNAY